MSSRCGGSSCTSITTVCSSRRRSTACASSCAGEAGGSRSPTCSGAGASTDWSCAATRARSCRGPRPRSSSSAVWRCWRASRLLPSSTSARARERSRWHWRRGCPRRASARSTCLADALALAAENAALNGLEERVELLQGDLLAPLAGRRFDLVASNPPYVAEGDAVDAEVSGYEPAMAVFAGADGRAIHERLAADAPRRCGREAGWSWRWRRVKQRGSRSTWRGSGTERSRQRATCVESSGC